MLDSLNTLCLIGVVGDLSDGELLRRFMTARDRSAQAAFAVLVDRHGPMVFRTVRHVLGNAHDADDAFQATFLLLARKAGSVRKAESVAGWLHGAARRIAVRARSAEGRRRNYERRVAKGASEPERVRSESWPELHEEISRLPRHYREPIVLCYLEGLTTEATARRLGCPQGTVMSRLSRARERLHARLTQRGFGHEDLNEGSASRFGIVAVPAALGKTTVEASTAIAGGAEVGAVGASASALSLARGEIIAMKVSTLKAIAATALAGAIGLGTAWGVGEFRQPGGTEPASEAASAVEGRGRADDKETKPDIEQLQGTWKVTKVTLDGKAIQDRGLSRARYTFRSNEIIIEGGEGTERHAFTLDPASNPTAMLTNRIAPDRRQSGWMLYELKGKSLRIAFNDAFQGKPEGFEPRPKLIIIDLERDATAVQENSFPIGLPRVVKAIPDRGDVDVDPATRGLRVTFDRDVDQGGMSVVGGGPTFPGDPSARPRWTDSRTIVIPLRLEPGRFYQLSINSSRFRNFQSAQGESALPYPIHFKTAPGKKNAAGKGKAQSEG